VDQIAAANDLLDKKYMNTDCAFCGTTWENFVEGNDQWFIDHTNLGSYETVLEVQSRPIFLNAAGYIEGNTKRKTISVAVCGVACQGHGNS